MNDWKEYKLKELTAKIGSGATPTGGSNAYKMKGISLIRSQNVLDFDFSYDGLAFIDDVQAEGLKNVIVEENDVLLNITGDSVARVCKVPKEVLPARVNQHVAIIRPNSKSSSDFLLYYLQAIKESLLVYSEIGGTRNALTKAMIENLEIKLPSLPEQNTIASILSSLDDKIDLVRRQNKTLEQLAETLFRQWFIEEAQEDWEEVRLRDLMEIKGGFSYDGKYIGFGSSILLGMGCVSYNERFLESGARLYGGVGGDNHRVQPGDIVVATRQQSDNMPILGFPAKIPNSLRGKRVIAGTNLYRVISRSHLNNNLLYYLFRSENYRRHIAANAKGSTVRMITKDAIEEFKIKLPSKDVIQKSVNVLTLLDNKIEFNQSQIDTFTQLRDTLLPKLMSGEVRVL